MFDFNKNSITVEINLYSNLTGTYYNLNLYNYSNSLNCVISYIERTNYRTYDNIYKLNLYKIDFLNNNQNIFISYNFYLNEYFIENNRITYISDIYLSCVISFPIILCFYLTKNSAEISVLGFNLKNNLSLENNYKANLQLDSFISLSYIKSSRFLENLKILVCFYGLFYTILNDKLDYYYRTYCINYDIKKNNFIDFLKVYFKNCINFNIYSFKIINNKFLICNDKYNFFGLYKFENTLSSSSYDKIKIYTKNCEIIKD